MKQKRQSHRYGDQGYPDRTMHHDGNKTVLPEVYRNGALIQREFKNLKKLIRFPPPNSDNTSISIVASEIAYSLDVILNAFERLEYHKWLTRFSDLLIDLTVINADAFAKVVQSKRLNLLQRCTKFLEPKRNQLVCVRFALLISQWFDCCPCPHKSENNKNKKNTKKKVKAYLPKNINFRLTELFELFPSTEEITNFIENRLISLDSDSSSSSNSSSSSSSTTTRSTGPDDGTVKKITMIQRVTSVLMIISCLGSCPRKVFVRNVSQISEFEFILQISRWVCFFSNRDVFVSKTLKKGISKNFISSKRWNGLILVIVHFLGKVFTYCTNITTDTIYSFLHLLCHIVEDTVIRSDILYVMGILLSNQVRILEKRLET